MKYVIVAGGTAGHINPALATGEKLRDLGHEVFFAGTPDRLESKLVPAAKFPFKSFVASGFNRNRPTTLFSALSSIHAATTLAKKWLEKIQPDAVVGFGCYVSLPICRAALALKIPVVIHEQNSVMGMANKFLAARSSCVCLTYKRADSGNAKRVEVTGNPVRKSVLEASGENGRKMLEVASDSKLLVVFGGSLGAEHINAEIVKMLPELFKIDNLEIVHISGEKYYDSVAEMVDKLDIDKTRYHLFSYQSEMGKTLAAADCVVSRAGASSLAEISALQVPSLLIPFPQATENHQYYNAQDLVQRGCAILIDDSAVSSQEFKDAVIRLVSDESLTSDMREALKQLNSANSVDKLADVVVNI